MVVSLYFHIPFCTRKCDYCHFFVLPDKPELKQQLLVGLEKEWLLRAPQLHNKSITTVYFGGGTPALIGPEAIARILDWVQPESSAEITLEANPENVSFELMSAYRKAGINRVSIGVQTLDSGLLTQLGRLHRPHKAVEAVLKTHEAGIDNISIDLMYDLPGQSLQQWETTLVQAGKLPIRHLSLYNLTIEPHTVFFKKEAQLRPLIPDEETSLNMYQQAIAYLESVGLQQYEISAFAQEGYASKHNSGYWTGREFLGFGPSAFSYWEGARFRNIAHLNKYCRGLEEGKFPIDFTETLEPEARRRELLAIRLRLREGVNLAEFEKGWGTVEASIWDDLTRLTQQGLIAQKEGTICLTGRGILCYDSVASELVYTQTT